MLARVHHRLPELYLALALAITGLLCFVTAPFFGPDEANQALRAISLGHGVLIADAPDEAGAEIDTGVLAAMEGVNELRMAWEKQSPDYRNRSYGAVRMEALKPLAAIRWSGRTKFVGFGNTASYPPMLYGPAIVGWRVGEALNLTVFQSLRLARWLNVAFCVVMCWGTLRLCGANRWCFFVFLMLPNVLFLNATCSQDALLLPSAALVVAIVARAVEGRRELFGWESTVAAVLLAACAAARPPYLGMVLLLILPGLELRRVGWRAWAGVAFVVAVAAVWRHMVAPLGFDTADEANPAIQYAFVRAHPLAASWAVWRGTGEAALDFVRRGTYVIGWNDLLGPWFLRLAGWVALAGTVYGAGGVRTWRGRWLVVACGVISLLGISAAEYVIWTPPGLGTVYGVLPRYWLPVLPLAFVAGPLIAKGKGAMKGAQGWCVFLAAGIACTLPWVAAVAFYGEGLWRVLTLLRV